jgi:hypothetical protein
LGLAQEPLVAVAAAMAIAMVHLLLPSLMAAKHILISAPQALYSAKSGRSLGSIEEASPNP